MINEERLLVRPRVADNRPALYQDRAFLTLADASPCWAPRCLEIKRINHLEEGAFIPLIARDVITIVVT